MSMDIKTDMGMDIREVRQAEAVEAYLDSVDRKSIINACPRFGKIKVALSILQRMNAKSVLILMPRRDIEKGWWDDFDKYWPTKTITVEFSTFVSIKKIVPTGPDDYSLVIIDEAHEMSAVQREAVKWLVDKYPTLGLTGTMTQKTRTELYDSLGLDVCYEYSIGQGVREGILADYQLVVHKIPLCTGTNRTYLTKKRRYTEKGFFDVLLHLMESGEGLQRHFMNLKLIRLIQNSYAKKKETLRLLDRYRDERILVFCGTTEVADSLGIPVYHSKKREKEIFDNFCKGEGHNHLATIKMMQLGVTIKPIRKGIINYMSGNPEDCAQKICRFLGYEYDNPEKKAEIHIVSSTEPFELGRLKTGLAFFDQSKIIIV